MDFPKDIDPMHFFLAMLAMSLTKKDRAEAESVERVEPLPQLPKTLRAEAEAIIKIPVSPPLPTENAVKAAEQGINEIHLLFGYAPHLKDGEKVSFTITTSHTNSTGTKTQTYSYKLIHPA